MGRPKAPTLQEDHQAFFARREAAEREQKRFHSCQARVNGAMAENDGWELISSDDLEAAYHSEIEAEGTGVSRILDLLKEKRV